jgi:hypothetical protein
VLALLVEMEPDQAKLMEAISVTGQSSISGDLTRIGSGSQFSVRRHAHHDAPTIECCTG